MPSGEIEVLTVQQVAGALQVSTKQVLRLIKQGKLPAFKVGHPWRIRRTDLEKFIAYRITYYGPYPAGSEIYRATVLDKYRNDPKKYYLYAEAFSGKLGLREHLEEELSRNTLSGMLDRAAAELPDLSLRGIPEG